MLKRTQQLQGLLQAQLPKSSGQRLQWKIWRRQGTHQDPLSCL